MVCYNSRGQSHQGGTLSGNEFDTSSPKARIFHKLQSDRGLSYNFMERFIKPVNGELMIWTKPVPGFPVRTIPLVFLSVSKIS